MKVQYPCIINPFTKGNIWDKYKKGKWECIVPPCDFIDEDGNLMNKRMRNWIAGYITRYTQRRVD